MKVGDLVRFKYVADMWWGGSEQYSGRIGVVVKKHGYVSRDKNKVRELWVVYWFDLAEERYVNEKNLIVLA